MSEHLTAERLAEYAANAERTMHLFGKKTMTVELTLWEAQSGARSWIALRKQLERLIKRQAEIVDNLENVIELHDAAREQLVHTRQQLKDAAIAPKETGHICPECGMTLVDGLCPARVLKFHGAEALVGRHMVAMRAVDPQDPEPDETKE